jgi:hypothetical protein
MEDTLLLFRLYAVGDIAFCKQATVTSTGTVFPEPYQAMNDLNSFAELRFGMNPDGCDAWKAFATEIRQVPSWNSRWFTTARCFFLSGGAKPCKPKSDDVDRIVDYATALEASLVPENDYNVRRITRRAAALITSDETKQREAISVLKAFYNIRSRVVHGSGLCDENREWLIQNSAGLEDCVRRVLVAALRRLPPSDADRCAVLRSLFDPTDQDCGKSAIEKFKEIKTDPVRIATAKEIAGMARVCVGEGLTRQSQDCSEGPEVRP